jgi:murein L,D-transpeptidase YafK
MQTKQNNIVPVIATEQDIQHLQSAIEPPKLASSMNYISPSPDEETLQATSLAVNKWLTAISEKNTNTYFESYAPAFSPADGSSKQSWERKRRHEIAQTPNQQIKISHLTFRQNGDQVVAVFTQTVSNETNKLTSIKTLDLVKVSGKWKILSEDEMALDEMAMLN